MVKGGGEQFGFGLSPEGRRKTREREAQERQARRDPRAEIEQAVREVQHEEAVIKNLRAREQAQRRKETEKRIGSAATERTEDSSSVIDDAMHQTFVEKMQQQAKLPRTQRSQVRVMTKEEQLREMATLREKRRVEEERARRLDTTITDPKAEAAEQRIRNQMKEAIERARQERSERHQGRIKRHAQSDSESSEGSELSEEHERSIQARESARELVARRHKERQEQLAAMKETMQDRLKELRSKVERPLQPKIETFEEDTSSLYRIIEEIKAKKAAEAERKKAALAEQKERERAQLDKIAAQRKQGKDKDYDDDFEVDLGEYAIDDAEGSQAT